MLDVLWNFPKSNPKFAEIIVKTHVFIIYFQLILVFRSDTGYSLLWVFIYGLVFLHIYALISFAFLRIIFSSRKTGFCDTFYECMFTAVRRGLIDGLFNVSRLSHLIDSLRKYQQSKMSTNVECSEATSRYYQCNRNLSALCIITVRSN